MPSTFFIFVLFRWKITCIVFFIADISQEFIIKAESVKQNSQIHWQAQLSNGSFHLAQLPATSHPLHVTSLANSVTYIWCSGDEEMVFTFGHFLSVRSVFFFLRPDVVHFYCDRLPDVDDKLYNTWFQELQQEFPNFNVHLNSSIEMCDNRSHPRVEFLEERLLEHGGFYINEDIVLLNQLPFEAINEPILFAFTEVGKLAVVSMLSTTTGFDSLRWLLYRNISSSQSLNCSDNICIDHTLDGVIHPKDLWCRNDSLSVLGMRLLYGTDTLPRAGPHDYEVVPRIAHYVWFGGGEMDYFFFLSILSCIYVLELEAVYIHGELPPSGDHWEQLGNETKLHWVYRSRPGHIYGLPINYIEHEADVALLDIMVHYGGIHVDPDMIFRKKLNPIFWRYDAIAAPARVKTALPFPVLFNWGVFLGRPYAPFWWLVQKAERHFLAEQWNWNSARVLYKIYERNPDLLQISPYLQVVCYTNCLLREPAKMRKGTVSSRWLQSVYALHFTVKPPTVFSSARSIFSSTGTFASAGKLILNNANRKYNPAISSKGNR